MTSPVDTSVKFFTSAMPGAPVLTGAAGSMIALLDACLKDGFGSKTATSLVVASGIATLTFASGVSAALVDSVILVAGATPSALNGEQKVLSADATTVTFATDEANVTATGTITFKIASLGFTKPFTGTNLAAYKSSDIESTGMYLRVSDTATTNTRVQGYEVMTAISTGTGIFPTTAQMSGGGYWPKADVAGSVPVAWTIVGDSRCFYIHVASYQANGTPTYDTSTLGSLRGFGDMIALRPSGDAYTCALAYLNNTDFVNYGNYGTFDNGSVSTIAVARSYTALGTSVLTTSWPYTGSSGACSGMDSSLGAFPNPVDGSLRLSRRYLKIADATAGVRCDVPGVYSVPQSGLLDTFAHHAIVPGTGDLVGRNLLGLVSPSSAINTVPSSSNAGITFLDITGPWRE